MVLVFVPIIPEIIERIQVENNIVEGDDEEIDNKINDKTNDLYAVSYSAATMISPFIGSYLQEMFLTLEMDPWGSPLQETCDFAGFCVLLFGIILTIGNCGLTVFSENRQF